jgi:hypothetical protein
MIARSAAILPRHSSCELTQFRRTFGDAVAPASSVRIEREFKEGNGRFRT